MTIPLPQRLVAAAVAFGSACWIPSLTATPAAALAQLDLRLTVMEMTIQLEIGESRTAADLIRANADLQELDRAGDGAVQRLLEQLLTAPLPEQITGVVQARTISRRVRVLYRGMMRVAVIHSFYSGALPSGENQVVRDQVQALTEAGVAVDLVGVETDALAKDAQYAMKTGIRLLVRQGIDPRSHLEALQPDIVHIHNTFPNFATRWLPEWRGPVVMTFHNYRAVCSNGTFFRSGRQCHDCSSGFLGTLSAIRHSCYRGSLAASMPVAVSREGFNRDISSGNVGGVSLSVGSHRILREVVPSSIPLTLIPNFVEDRAMVSDAVRDSVWLAAGRLSPEKGFEALLRDWPRGHRLRVVGAGPDSKRIGQLAAGREDITVQEPVSRDELRELMETHVGLVFPSLWHEVDPQIVAEAMCAGLPVVANEANVVADLVRSTKAGSTYSNQSDLAQALTAVVDAHAEMSAAARRYYETNLTPQTWIKRTLAHFDHVRHEYEQHGVLLSKSKS